MPPGGAAVAWLAFFRGVSAKIVSVPLVAFVLGLLIPGLVGFQLLMRGADRETHEKAVAMLAMVSAVRRAADEDGDMPAQLARTGYLHRGTAAANLVIRKYDLGSHEDSFIYKRVAYNPTDLHDLANGIETRMIRTFAATPSLKQAEEEVDDHGRPMRVLATPVAVSSDRCLQCHGSPKAAPEWRLKRYGRVAGFGWKRGQVVAADVIYVPSGFPRDQAVAIFWSVIKSVGVLALMCGFMLFYRAHVLITRPVTRMLDASEAVQRGEWPRWGDRRFPDELGMLANSFQTTTLCLRDKVVREEKLRALFQQFIPASIAATALGKNADEILVGTRHAVTVMIINIRNFKLLIDHLPPDQTVAVLNEYFANVNQIIVANNGLVSKYMGDSVLALFGMPLTQENHALCAVKAALSIPAALQDMYVRLDEKYGWELGVGIGISTGAPIIGSFGSSEHLEYTVLGEVVAEAANLESATKGVPEEDSILISEATYRCVMSDVHVLDLGYKPCGSGGSNIHAYVVQGFRTEVRSSLAA